MKVYVDLPVLDGAITGRWDNVAHFESKEMAVAWLKVVFGEHAVDNEGKVCLLTIAEGDYERD